MLLYYITERRGFEGTDAAQRRQLLVTIGAAARAGVDYIQLREKDLTAHDLERLSRVAVQTVRENSTTTRFLINGRADVALACGADGVHLPAGELNASEVRALWMRASDRKPLIAVSAHMIDEVFATAGLGADFAVLAPIFEKVHTEVRGIGLDVLRAACSGLSQQRRLAVLALGGVTLANATACLDAGAAGVAGIRLFQSGDVVETVRRLRAMERRGQEKPLTADRRR